MSVRLARSSRWQVPRHAAADSGGFRRRVGRTGFSSIGRASRSWRRRAVLRVRSAASVSMICRATSLVVEALSRAETFSGLKNAGLVMVMMIVFRSAAWMYPSGRRLIQAGKGRPENKRPGASPTFHSHSALLPVHPWSAQRMKSLSCPKIFGRAFAGLAVLDNLVGDLLAIRERTHSGALDSRRMHENVRATVVRLDEAEALGGVEPFYSTSIHDDFLSEQSLWFPRCLAG